MRDQSSPEWGPVKWSIIVKVMTMKQNDSTEHVLMEVDELVAGAFEDLQ